MAGRNWLARQERQEHCDKEASNTLQRAENAAVRGLWRRQDEVKRMTLELHDPLVEEANAIRRDVSEEQEMARALSKRLARLEEHLAEVGEDQGLAMIEKAESWDTAQENAEEAHPW
eukprot:g32856.t1